MSESKIVVFDLDETLGYFTQLFIIWESIECYFKEKKRSHNLGQEQFNKILGLFPEYVRPNIDTILEFLKDKKTKKACKNVMIYTNNQRKKEWVYLIKSYFV